MYILNNAIFLSTVAKSFPLCNFNSQIWVPQPGLDQIEVS